MTQDGLLLGAVHLLSSTKPFFESYHSYLEGAKEVRGGMHLSMKQQRENVAAAGSFRIACSEAISSRYIPTRDSQRIDSAVIGSIDGTDEPSLHVCRIFLALHKEPGINLIDAIYQQVFSPIQGHYLAVVSQICPQSRFIIMSSGIPISPVIAKSRDHTIFFWTNEERPEERLKNTYKDEFAFYRLPVLVNGCLVVKTTFLCQKMKHWSREFSDLKLCAAFEHSLLKSWKPK